MESKKDQIIALLRLGWSFRNIAKEVGCSISAVSFHANNLVLLDQEAKGKFKTRYNWKEVQRYHDEELLVADRGKTARTHLKAKLIKQGFLKKECAICGIAEWMGKPLAFDLDHING